jgi:hypothetical protein
MMYFQISELHNFGGFFGGDTVTLSGAPWAEAAADAQTLTIDQAALTNVADRYTLAVGMVLALVFVGERVEQATLCAGPDPDALQTALGDPVLPDTLTAPLIICHKCVDCELWVVGAPPDCPLCPA